MRCIAILICLAGCLLAAPRGAHAHAQLRGAEPAAGALVAAPPAEILLTFNEPVSLLRVRWFAPDGTTEETSARAEGPVLRIAVPPGVPAGTQSVTWRIVSLDGHPVGGTHVFSIGVRSAAAVIAETGDGADRGAARFAAAARFALVLTLVFGVGALLWAAVAGLPAARWARIAACATAPAALLALGAQGLDLAGAGAGAGYAALLTAEPWRLAAASPLLATAVAAVLAGGIAAAGAGRGLPVLIAWGLASLSFALSGHAAAAEPRPWMAVAAAIHAGAMLFWIGALPGLATALRRGAGPGLLRRFSSLATPLVAALVLSGAALAWVQVGTPEALWQTAYGRVLLLKLALAAMLLSLAAVNRFVLTPAFEFAESPGSPEVYSAARRRLVRSVKAELVLGLAILIAVAAFRLTPPPRALAVVHQHLHSAAAMADVTLVPGRPGLNRIELRLTDGAGRPLEPLELGLAFALPDIGLGPVAAAARADGSGGWLAEAWLPQGEVWTVEVEILIDDFRKEFLVGTVEIGGGRTGR